MEKPAFDNLVNNTNDQAKNHNDDQAENHTAPEKPPEQPGSCKHGDIRDKLEKEPKSPDEEETTNHSMSTDSSGVGEKTA